MIKIRHEDRFTDAEMLDLFTWDAKPKPRGKRVWKDTRKRGLKKAVQPCDNIREGITVHAPGTKQRLADLKAFYDIAMLMDEEDRPTPF